jgi:hypothetical protein
MLMPGRYLTLYRSYMGKANIKNELVALIMNIGIVKILNSNNSLILISSLAPISEKYLGLYSLL